MPANTISVTRPGIFGNPFTIQQMQEAGFSNPRKMSIHAFREWLKEEPNEWNIQYPEKRKKLLENLHRLRNKNLACFCAQDEECHADVLLEAAQQRSHI